MRVGVCDVIRMCTRIGIPARVELEGLDEVTLQLQILILELMERRV